MTINEIIKWLEGFQHEPIYPGTSIEVAVAKSAKVEFAKEVAAKLRENQQSFDPAPSEGDTTINVGD
ncbi:hypothetical protein [Aestuariivirga sp.]|uniref:hypothetical protein n=1 Tax=Aestuariivirga sp. TaxID=2650926 RepID=UPI0039E4CA25